MLPHEQAAYQGAKLTRENFKKFFPCAGAYSYMNCCGLGYIGPPMTCQCPLKQLCIKETNMMRLQQKELLGLDRARLEKQNLTRAERQEEMGIRRQSAKQISKETGFDVIGYRDRIRREKGKS